MIPWLGPTPAFPPLESAPAELGGLLAAGGALTPDWILEAYRHGIFPWFAEGEPILWWSPDPRLVLFPERIKVSKSLQKRLRNGGFSVTFDRAFEQVIRCCAGPRAGAAGTWISPDMQAAYCRLHTMGYAHSVETWYQGHLVGGLYGLALGRAFFGESMFSRHNDASKVALVHLAQRLQALDFGVIDCQMTTAHLCSLGAAEISRIEFAAVLAELTPNGPPPGRWYDALPPVDTELGTQLNAGL